MSVCGGECCVWLTGCVSNLKFIFERWGRCSRVMEGVVNGLLVAMIFLLLVNYCVGTCISPVCGGIWLC
jgi:hypothetical protein